MSNSSETGAVAPNVLEDVVKHNLCIGCGTCAGVCPRGALRIGWDARGCYVAEEGDGTCSHCGLCLKSCPFGDGNPDEDTIAQGLFAEGEARHVPQIGLYRSSWVGCVSDDKDRISSASGGLATWFLKRLLSEGIVDRVACVENVGEPGMFFAYRVCQSADELDKTRRSAYYPVEMSRIIREIAASGGSYAVTCLPCFAKALRLACAGIPALRRRVRCIIGLVCGHTVSSRFADYAAACTGGGTEGLTRVIFKGKDPMFPATDHVTECGWSKGDTEVRRTVLWSEGLAEAWCNDWFTPNSCFYCDDVFAETADIAFMDAWLPDHESDYRGTSIAIARSETADRLIHEGILSGAVCVSECPVEDVIASQSAVVRNKHGGLAHRLWIAKEAGRHVPAKRVQPSRAGDVDQAKTWEAQMQASAVGSVLWDRKMKIGKFQERMRGICGWKVAKPRRRFVPGAIRRIGRLLCWRAL